LSEFENKSYYNVALLFQYLEERFGKSTRIFASVAFSIQTVLRTALVLYAASLALNAIAGFSQTVSMAVVGILCTFYSTVGGIKAVIVTDLFQVSPGSYMYCIDRLSIQSDFFRFFFPPHCSSR